MPSTILRLLLGLGCTVLLGAGEAPAARGLKPMAITTPDGRTVTTITSSQALIIGNSAYANQAWSALAGVKEDTAAVRAALERHGFEVAVAMDLNKAAMVEAVDSFVADHGGDANGRVVIYYAGHGYTRGGANGVGYLVPVDAPSPTDRQFTAKAYPIQQMKIKAAEVAARHVLFAFDCCFGGSVFTPLRGAAVDTPLSEAGAPVRLFLTAGAADEQVPDVSFFRQEFVTGIDGAADNNRDGWVTGKELSFHLTQTVRDRARAAGLKLTPQAGVSEQEGFNRGDIVFQVPKAAPLPPPATPPAAGDFSLDDLAAADSNARAWTDWQGKMEAAFLQVQKVEADAAAGPAYKQGAWRKFAAAFAADNPNSTKDEAMRATAMAAIQRYGGDAGAAGVHARAGTAAEESFEGLAPKGRTPTVPATPVAVPALPETPSPPVAGQATGQPAAVGQDQAQADAQLVPMLGRWTDPNAPGGLRLVYSVTRNELSITNDLIRAKMTDNSSILQVTRERLRLKDGRLQFIGRSSRGVSTCIELSLNGRRLTWSNGNQTINLIREE